jgi:hypothetical protein
MKTVTIILFIILLVASGIGLATYMKNKEKVTTAMTTTDTTITPTSDIGTPEPTVKVQQITLLVSSPANGITVTSPTVVIKGKTIPKADVFVNDSQTTADAQGNFSVTLTLDEGENTVVVAANDADGNFAEQELIITYDPGE